MTGAQYEETKDRIEEAREKIKRLNARGQIVAQLADVLPLAIEYEEKFSEKRETEKAELENKGADLAEAEKRLTTMVGYLRETYKTDYDEAAEANEDAWMAKVDADAARQLEEDRAKYIEVEDELTGDYTVTEVVPEPESEPELEEFKLIDEEPVEKEKKEETVEEKAKYGIRKTRKILNVLEDKEHIGLNAARAALRVAENRYEQGNFEDAVKATKKAVERIAAYRKEIGEAEEKPAEEPAEEEEAAEEEKPEIEYIHPSAQNIINFIKELDEAKEEGKDVEEALSYAQDALNLIGNERDERFKRAQEIYHGVDVEEEEPEIDVEAKTAYEQEFWKYTGEAFQAEIGEIDEAERLQAEAHELAKKSDYISALAKIKEARRVLKGEDVEEEKEIKPPEPWGRTVLTKEINYSPDDRALAEVMVEAIKRKGFKAGLRELEEGTVLVSYDYDSEQTKDMKAVEKERRKTTSGAWRFGLEPVEYNVLMNKEKKARNYLTLLDKRGMLTKPGLMWNEYRIEPIPVIVADYLKELAEGLVKAAKKTGESDELMLQHKTISKDFKETDVALANLYVSMIESLVGEAGECQTTPEKEKGIRWVTVFYDPSDPRTTDFENSIEDMKRRFDDKVSITMPEEIFEMFLRRPEGNPYGDYLRTKERRGEVKRKWGRKREVEIPLATNEGFNVDREKMKDTLEAPRAKRQTEEEKEQTPKDIEERQRKKQEDLRKELEEMEKQGKPLEIRPVYKGPAKKEKPEEEVPTADDILLD